MVQIPLTIPSVSARQTKSTSVPFQCTISVVQETKFIYDIIGYNLFHLGKNQMRRESAILIKNNLRFCKRKISCSGNTELDWLELCLPEKYVLSLMSIILTFRTLIFSVLQTKSRKMPMYSFLEI